MVTSEQACSRPAAISIVIVEKRPYLSAGLRRLLSGQDSVEVVAETTDVRTLPAELTASRPDVLLLSYSADDDLADTLRGIRATLPDTAVVLYGLPPTSTVAITALRLGVRGLIDDVAGFGDLVAALHVVARGQAIISPQLASNLAVLDSRSFVEPSAGVGGAPRLTSRELEVLRLIANGLTNRGIAVLCSLSEHTIRAHLREIMRKLSARSRIEAVSLGIRHGLIRPPEQERLSVQREPLP